MNEIMKLNKIATEANYMSNLYWKLAAAIKIAIQNLLPNYQKKLKIYESK